MEAITSMSPKRVSELSKVQQKLDILLVGTSRRLLIINIQKGQV